MIKCSLNQYLIYFLSKSTVSDLTDNIVIHGKHEKKKRCADIYSVHR